MATRDKADSSGLGLARSRDEARAFLQARIQRFNGIMATISFCFYFANHTLEQLASGDPNGWLRRSDFAHLAATLVTFGVWVACRVRSWPSTRLPLFDAAGAVAGAIGFAWMGYEARATPAGVFPMLLATVHMAFGRAVLVPSTPSRTLAIHVGVFVPVLVSTYFNMVLQAPDQAIKRTCYIGMWCTAALVMTTLTSRVLYGLREQVRETMKLGQYTLDEKIGAGGMGVVYRASHAMLRRPTAIKLLPPGQSGERSLTRFEREVQLTSQLTHPNTVCIYDFGRTPTGIFYYAMEYLDGPNIEELVRADGPQPAGRVIHMLRQIAGSLVEAHGVGLIHRDVKPANVIVCERGGVFDVVKVVDFGLVKESGKAASTATDTAEGTLAGTPLYLSPESITAPDEITAAADLYALGAVGYFLLTGRNVFSASTVIEVLAQHLDAAPAPPSVVLGTPVPADLEALVLGCLEKRPELRPTSVELEAALAECADAGAWTRADAARWWEERSPLLEKKRRPPRAPTPETVEIDLRRRAGAGRSDAADALEARARASSGSPRTGA